VSAATGVYLFAAVNFLFCLLLLTFILAGFGWVKALFAPIMYLGFALPLFTMAIDTYTNPLQLLSTKVAYTLLQVFGANPYLDDAQTIALDNFVLNVAVPCSGLKLMLALGAFTTFFMLVANLRWWGNLVLIAQWVPLALFINGLRIAMIGIVGNSYGEEAGMQFHDYSGYITLVVCFIILFRIARGLGWKD
jgi:exosortase